MAQSPNRQSAILYWRWSTFLSQTVAMSLKQALSAGDCLIPGISREDSSFGSLTVPSLSRLSALPNTRNKTLNCERPFRLLGPSLSPTIRRAGLAPQCSQPASEKHGLSSKWQCSLPHQATYVGRICGLPACHILSPRSLAATSMSAG